MAATTHGYGGEFSSDEDIEKIEQKSEHFIQSKFEQHSVKPTKKQIEDAIESIKRLPIDQDLQLTDELLAGLLDHYKTQRGPIVDSTRKLYKKIVLRLVRGDQDDEASKESNGNSNNNNIEIINKRAPQQRPAADSYSSDEEDPIVPESDNVISKKSQDDNNMEVDSETPTGPIRETKQVDITDTEDESDESTDEHSSESDSEQNLSPIKPPANLGGDEIQTVKQSESSVKQRPIAQSTPKTDSVKKPYTRSQRIAAARALAREKSPVEIKRTQTPVANDTNRSSRGRYIAMTVGLLVVFLAFVLFYFRSSLIKTAEPLLSRKISF